MRRRRRDADWSTTTLCCVVSPCFAARSFKVFSALDLAGRLQMDVSQVAALLALPVLLLLWARERRRVAALTKQVAQLQLAVATKNN